MYRDSTSQYKWTAQNERSINVIIYYILWLLGWIYIYFIRFYSILFLLSGKLSLTRQKLHNINFVISIATVCVWPLCRVYFFSNGNRFEWNMFSNHRNFSAKKLFYYIFFHLLSFVMSTNNKHAITNLFLWCFCVAVEKFVAFLWINPHFTAQPDTLFTFFGCFVNDISSNIFYLLCRWFSMNNFERWTCMIVAHTMYCISLTRTICISAARHYGYFSLTFFCVFLN